MNLDYRITDRLYASARPHPVRLLQARNLRSAVGALIERDQWYLQLEGSDDALPVELDPETVSLARERPQSIWQVNTQIDGAGTMVAFAPPRVVDLAHRIPIRVPELFLEKLASIGLKLGSDLAHTSVITHLHGRAAAIGQRGLVGLGSRDADRITVWLPTGAAVELELRVAHGEGYLCVHSVHGRDEGDEAHSGPCVRLNLRRGAELPLVDESAAPVAKALLGCFQPARSRILSAWASYGQIANDLALDRLERRRAFDLPFHEAKQRGHGWSVVALLEAEAREAWLEPNAQVGRAVRIDQPVILGDTDVGGALTITEMVPGGGNRVEVRLKVAGRGVVVPEKGVLRATENRGNLVQRSRERAALEQLLAGNAANRNLLAALAQPTEAIAPTLVPLPAEPVENLDLEQRRAVQLMVGCRDLVAIQGPPGTGKTRVIAEALRQIAVRSRAEGRQASVLVSSVQNEAVGNVARRMDATDGVVVRYVMRRASAQDQEELEWANRLISQREKTAKDLEARLCGLPNYELDDRLRSQCDELEVIRNLARGEKPDTAAMAKDIQDAISGETALPYGLREEGKALCVALTAWHPNAQNSATKRQHPSAPPLDNPEEWERWWADAKATWPADQAAGVGMAVQKVVAALSAVGGRKELLLPRAHAALRELVLSQVQKPVTVHITGEDSSPFPKVEAWAATALREVESQRKALDGTPAAIRLRFLRALQEDPHAWERIVQKHANTVAATCSMSAGANPSGEHFDYVIIDEAGRASPFELLIPMVQGKRVILIGDHRQLPPTVDDAIARRAEAAHAGADIRCETLFYELWRHLPSACIGQLRTQYRMHEAIGNIIDTVFYRPEGEGISHHFSGPNATKRLFTRGPYPGRPVVWHAVQPMSKNPYENAEEAEMVAKLVAKYRADGVKSDEIAVIIPYTLQRDLVGRILSNAGLAGAAQVLTVDACQGREWPVVLFCTTRVDRRAGFLASPHRLNVALSRAQSQLVVLGCRSRLQAARARALSQVLDLLPTDEVTDAS